MLKRAIMCFGVLQVVAAFFLLLGLLPVGWVTASAVGLLACLVALEFQDRRAASS
jgi:hypothetical protein